MKITLKEVSSKRELKQFVNFQYRLYSENKFWVPPPRIDELKSLMKKSNPAFDFCESKYWLAYMGNRIVGRVAGIINYNYNEKWNQKTARFGWFDFIDDPDVATKLLSKVEEWAKEKGMEDIQGPLGFTDMDGEGTLIEGYEETSTLGSIYNFPYYSNHIEKQGYSKESDWIEYEITIKPQIPEKINRIAEIALKRNNLKILDVKKSKELLPYAREIFTVLNSAYKDLFGFVELSERQIDLYVKQYFSFVLPEYLPVVLDSDGKVVAFGIAMPSLSAAFQKNKGRLFPLGFVHILKALKNNNKADLYLTGVRPDMQNKGINAIIVREINKAFIKNNVTKVETNRELEANEKIQAQWRYYEHRQHKRRRCYKKSII